MKQEIEASHNDFIQRLTEASAPEHQNLGIVELFAAENLSFETILDDATGMRLMHKYAKIGDVTVIRQLENRADPTVTTMGGFTPLHLAAAMGHKDVVDELLLVDKWPNVKGDVTSSDGITALHLAAYGGYESIVRSLLQRYGDESAADVNAQDDVLGRTALHQAVGGGHLNVVELLLNFPGIDICIRDTVQDLTPLLMEVMKPKNSCNLDLVKKLLVARPDQITHRVGNNARSFSEQQTKIKSVHWLAFCPIQLFDSDRVLLRGLGYGQEKKSTVSLQSKLKKYGRIEKEMKRKDGSSSEGEWDHTDLIARRKLEVESKKLLAESRWSSSSKFLETGRGLIGEVIRDLHLNYKVPMGGQTVLHLAATQDNAQVLSHLLHNCTGAESSVSAADGSGMSPLHCAVRTESMEAFTVLMSHREVDVNAGLKAGARLARPPWTGLTLSSWWKTNTSEPYRFYKASCESDTPLHLAIRCCNSFSLRKMVMQFCNHPSFKPSMYNECGVLPLDLAWLRSSCSLQFGSSSVQLHSALDMLERQPGNEPLMNEVNRMKMGAQNSVNAVLVTATLLGGVTFGAFLQPPFGSGFDYNSRAVRFFWTYNCMSFYFSMYTILCCLGTTMVTTQHTQRLTGGMDPTTSTPLRVFYAHEQAQLVVPLIFCVVSGIGAFIGAGYGNLPPNTRTLMRVCTILGLLLVLIQALLRVLFTFQLYLDVKVGVKTRYYRLKYLIFGLLCSSPREILCIPFRSSVSRSVPIDRNDYWRQRRLAILAIHVYGIVGMTIYAVI